MSDFEIALRRIVGAQTGEEAGQAFTQFARHEGYENTVLARFSNRRLTELHLVDFPSGYVETYLDLGWDRSDPMSHEAWRSCVPFTWQEALDRGAFSAAQRRQMSVSGDMGVHSGMTIPVHGPNGVLDAIALSVREKRECVDETRRWLVSTAAVATISRFLELVPRVEASDGVLIAQGRERQSLAVAQDAAGNLGMDLQALAAANPAMRQTGVRLPGAYLRALVMVEVASSRWAMGLTKLGEAVVCQRSCRPYADLETWGLIVICEDRVRGRRFLGVSALGQALLRCDPRTDLLRQIVRKAEVDRREKADAFAGECDDDD